MVTDYKGYRIEAYEVEPGRWRVRLRRIDGHRIKTEAGVGDVASTKGTGVHSADEAIAIAKELIDAGSLGRGSRPDAGWVDLVN
jgi:hypothetical protein